MIKFFRSEEHEGYIAVVLELLVSSAFWRMMSPILKRYWKNTSNLRRDGSKGEREKQGRGSGWR